MDHPIDMKHRIEYIWAKDQQGKVVAAKKLLSTEKPELVHWLSLSTKLLTIFVACNRYGVWASEAFKLEPRAVKGDPVEPISEYCVLQVPLATSCYLLLPLATSCYLLLPLGAPRCPSLPLATSCYLSLPVAGLSLLVIQFCVCLFVWSLSSLVLSLSFLVWSLSFLLHGRSRVLFGLCLSTSSPSLSTVCDHLSSLLLNKHLMNNTVRLWH